MIKKIFYCLSIFSFCFIFSTCENGDRTITCFPETDINLNLSLSLPLYQNLNSIGGWVYINAGPFSGTRGLIIVRNGENSFKAYDRNAPHLCPSANSTLEVRDDLYIFCPEDGAKWILSTGQPLEGASNPPRSYNTQLIGNNLFISL